MGCADVATKQDLAALEMKFEALRAEIGAEIKDLKSTLLMWQVPTIIGSMAVLLMLSRVA